MMVRSEKFSTISVIKAKDGKPSTRLSRRNRQKATCADRHTKGKSAKGTLVTAVTVACGPSAAYRNKLSIIVNIFTSEPSYTDKSKVMAYKSTKLKVIPCQNTATKRLVCSYTLLLARNKPFCQL